MKTSLTFWTSIFGTTRLVRNLVLPAVLSGAVVLGLNANVRADLVATASEDGGPAVTLFDITGTPSSYPGLSGSNTTTVGDFTLVVQGAQADLNPSPTEAELLSSTTSLKNNAAGTHSLLISISATGYNSPSATTTALQLLSHIGGSVANSGAGNSLVFQSYVDPTNTPTTTGAYTSGPQTPSIATVGSFQSDASSTISTLAPPFAMLETIRFTLSGGATVNYSSSETLSPAVNSVPEPASLVMAATGLPALGIYMIRRRRRQV